MIEIPMDEETVRYVSRWGGFCRDCADMADEGVCPYSGLPCGDRDRAVRHVIEALNYGYKHGYLKFPA